MSWVALALPMAGADPPPVRVGLGYSVPWAYQAPDGSPAGFYVDAIREAARRQRRTVEFVFWKDGMEKAVHGQAVDLWAAAVATPERGKTIHFTTPWTSMPYFVAVPKNSPVQGIADLRSRTLAYTAPFPFSASLEQLLPATALRKVADLRQSFQQLCDGTADAVLYFQDTATFAVTGSPQFFDCVGGGFRTFAFPHELVKLSLAALPDRRELAGQFRHALGEMERDQTLARMSAFPLTGDRRVLEMFEEERAGHHVLVLNLALGFGFVLLALGIADAVRLRRAYRQTERSLRMALAASQAKGEFLATMSHEIRTPMTAVLGYLEMLMAGPLSHDQRQYAAEASQATSSLLTLISTLFEYSRASRGALAAESHHFEISALMDDCVAAVLLDAEGKGLEITVALDPSLPRQLMGDAVRFRQVILNLLSNAVKFTPSGWVKVEAGYRAGVLEISVADSGIGIPEEKRDLIFLPFTQADSSDTRRYGGVGLGLAIVAELCRAMNGTWKVESKPGEGSRFTVRFRVEQGPDGRGWLHDLNSLSGAAAWLVGSSSHAQSEVLEQYLRHIGCQVRRAFTAAELKQELARPGRGTIFCFVHGPDWGAETAQLARDKMAGAIFILTGSLTYLNGAGAELRGAFPRTLLLPVGARGLHEALKDGIPVPAAAAVAAGTRVLVVDDNGVNRRLLSTLLKKLGCEPVVAEGGREAVELLRHQRVALILMDCQMPEMDGFETTRVLRCCAAADTETPICGVSAADDAGMRERCLASGMNDYIAKPVSLDSLRDLLRRHAVADGTVSRP